MKKVRGCKGWTHAKAYGCKSEYMHYNNEYIGCACTYADMIDFIKTGNREWINTDWEWVKTV